MIGATHVRSCQIGDGSPSTVLPESRPDVSPAFGPPDARVSECGYKVKTVCRILRCGGALGDGGGAEGMHRVSASAALFASVNQFIIVHADSGRLRLCCGLG